MVGCALHDVAVVVVAFLDFCHAAGISSAGCGELVHALFWFQATGCVVVLGGGTQLEGMTDQVAAAVVGEWMEAHCVEERAAGRWSSE